MFHTFQHWGYNAFSHNYSGGRRRVRFLGIGWLVEVGEKLRDRAVTGTGYLVFGRVRLILTCPTVAGRLSVVCLSSGQRCLADFTAGRCQVGRTRGRSRPASWRCLTDIWIVWVVQNLARHPARHRPIYWRSDCDEMPQQVLSPSQK